MVVRCPGCAKEIPETADICPHCKWDFRSPAERARSPQPPAKDAAAPPKDKPAQPPAQRPAPEKPAQPRPAAKPPERPPAKPAAGPAAKPPARPGDRPPPAAGTKPPERPPAKPAAGPAAKPPARPGDKPAPAGTKPPARPGDKPRPAAGAAPPAKDAPGKAPAKPGEKPEAAAGSKPPAKPGEKAEAAAGSKPPAKPGEKAEAAPKRGIPLEKTDEGRPIAAKKPANGKPTPGGKAKPARRPTMVERCPGCAKPISESAEICPHCKRDFRATAQAAPKKRTADPQRKDDDLPPHMRADLDAPPKSDSPEDAEKVLPPHMLESLEEGQKRLAQDEKPGANSTVVSAAIGVLVVVGIWLVPKLLSKPKEQKVDPPPRVVAKAPPKPIEAPKAPEEMKDAPDEDENANVAPPAEEPKPATRKRGRRGRRSRRRANANNAAESPMIIASSRPPPQQPRRATKWRIRGTIFNLVTLEPVGDVNITLIGGGTQKRTVSGPDGRFRATVPPASSGYEMSVQHDEYHSALVTDRTISHYSDMDEDERKEEAKKLVKFSPSNPPLKAPDSGTLEKQFIMVPREKHGKSLEEALAD